MLLSRNTVITVIVLTALCYLIVFHKMGSHPIRMWDESYFAVHSYEMLQKGSWLVSYFDGQPDLRGSKPPLQNWLQMALINTIGMNTVAIRLPSALAALATVLVLFFFLKKEHSELLALTASLILLSAQGFITWHTARTGDADTLLALSMLMQFISFYYWIKSGFNMKWLCLLGATFVMAFLTKSFAGFFFVPGFVVYLLINYRQHLKTIIGNPINYLIFSISLTPVVAYIYYRNQLQPGYVQYALHSHAGRYTEVIGPHGHPWLFYILNYIRERYTWWIVPATIGLIMAVVSRNRQLPFYSATVVFLSFLILISASRSKLGWYDNPTYPLLAMITAFPIHAFLNARLVKGIPAKVLLALLCSLPLMYMYRQSQSNYPGWADRAFEIKEFILHEMFMNNQDPMGLKVLPHTYYGGLLFYKHAFSKRNQTLEIAHDLNFKIGDRILLSDATNSKILSEKYSTDTIMIKDKCLLIGIEDYKQ